MGNVAAAELRPFEHPDADHKFLGLVIHGTGEQPHGDMLRHVAREFLPLIRRRIDRTASIAAKPLDEGDPAEVCLWFRHKNEMYELHFLEVWWSHAFERIPLGAFVAGLWGFFLSWLTDRNHRQERRRSWGWLLVGLLLRILTNVALSVLAACALLPMLLATLAELVGLPRVLPRGAANRMHSILERLANFVMCGQTIIVELMVIVASPVLILLLLLLWFVESVPSRHFLPRWLFDAHRSLVNMLTRQLGDMWVYMLQPWEASQIRIRMEERFHRLAALSNRTPGQTRVETVFVIAYSMGSVVAYETLTGQRMTRLIQGTFPVEAPPNLHFITVGSALNSSWDFVPEDERFRFYRQFPPNVQWLNLWSDYDPVARGPLRPPDPLSGWGKGAPRQEKVTNQMDLFLDHFAYWNNAEEVVAKILDTITFPRLHTELEMNIPARRRRVRFLAALKALAWLVFPAVYFLLFITGWGQCISGWVDQIFLEDKTWRRYVLSPALWAAVAAAATAVVYSTMVKWAWDCWDRNSKYLPPRGETT